MEHPVAGIDGVELDIPRLRDSDQDRVSWKPGGLRSASPFGPGHDELMPVEVDGVVIHS